MAAIRGDTSPAGLLIGGPLELLARRIAGAPRRDEEREAARGEERADKE